MLGFSAGMVFIFAVFAGGAVDRLYGLPFLEKLPDLSRTAGSSSAQVVKEKIISEESVVSKIVEKSAPSVVTVSIKKVTRVPDISRALPFDPFGFFNTQPKEKKIEQDIGSGFVVDENGLVVTNKHVVADTQAEYKIITKDNHIYNVQKIYRDPANDMAVLKVDAHLPAVELGNSDNLKVGQMAIAIGTALGEFRHTVTTGVISGLGRGITAGSPLQGSVERLDNVIQTDAAINPGNSGGPLFNSLGQVIGVNVAVAQGGQNIGFAIPINVVKSSLDNFKSTGEFDRPFLGVRYQIISRQAALLNEVPQGAYVIEVIADSSADKAEIKKDDIIVRFDDKRLSDKDTSLGELINGKKIGDKVKVELWRDGKTIKKEVLLEKKK